MATFTCYVPTNIFGNGYSPRFEMTYGDGSVFQLSSKKFYELFGGSFGYFPNDTPSGYVTTYGVYNYRDEITRLWTADGGGYDATVIFDLKDTGTWRELFSYMFYLNDTIYGSNGRDKLNGYNGDDYIVGDGGNDMLKGGPGSDGFYFEAFDGRDLIKDFKWRSDTIWLDQSLATTVEQIYEAAIFLKKGVILDFGSTVIKIAKLNPGSFEDVDFGIV